MRLLKVSFFACLIIIIVLATSTLYFRDLSVWQENNLQLRREQNRTLSVQINALHSEKNSLLVYIDSLEENNTLLRSENEDLLVQNQILEDAVNDLENNYAELQIEYTTLNETYDLYLREYEKLRDEINLRVLHPTEDEKLLITPDDPAVQSLVLSVTGGWSDQSDWNEYWDDVKALYDWVVNNVEYRYDGLCSILPDTPYGDVEYFNEMWQLPSETINERKGDCDDQAILLASLIYAYNEKQYTTYCIVTWNHVAVFVPVSNDEICILDPTMEFYTNDGWPSYNITAKDMEEEVTYWINRFTLTEVERIFSLTIWQEFTSTDDFINWMHNIYP